MTFNDKKMYVRQKKILPQNIYFSYILFYAYTYILDPVSPSILFIF
jgi:hypothetical protein